MHRPLQRWTRGLCTLLAITVLATTSAVAADEADVKRLLIEIDKIPMVDSHSHVPLPASDGDLFHENGFHYDVPWLLGNTTYVGEFIHGKDWPEIKSTLEINGHHAYYRVIRQALVDLYGLDPNDELNDHNVEAISSQMDAKHRDPTAWYGEVYHRANVSHVVWLDAQPGVAGSPDGELKQMHEPGNQLPHTQLHPMWNIDFAIVFIATLPSKKDIEKTGFPHRIDQTEKRFGVKLRNLADMEALIDREITKFFAAGGVGLKSTSAYFRPLNFDAKVPRAEAAAIFAEVVARKTLPEHKRTRLEDYLMTKVLEKLNQLKKPIQFHTGNQQNWNLVLNSNPLGLNQLLYDGQFSNVKFVILHGGFPYVEEAITMVRYYPNAYLDLAWMTLFSPAAAKHALAEAIDMLHGGQLMFGTDSANLEEMYGTVKFTRRILAEVLADKIESGFLTQTAALQIARRILCTNATELYGLQDSSSCSSSPVTGSEAEPKHSAAPNQN